MTLDVPAAAIGNATRDALDAARGDRVMAAQALGVSVSALYARVAAYQLRAWLDRAWPLRRAHLIARDVDVISQATGAGERFFVLAAHGAYADGEHVNRVPLNGSRPRERVTCQVCKATKKEKSE